ncbi:ankyrin repeat domain-containing protein [Comamonas testosteroni]
MNVKEINMDFNDVLKYIFHNQKEELKIKLDSMEPLSEEVIDEFLLYATQQGKEQIIIDLIKRGADKNKVLLGGSSLICYAIAGGMKELVFFLVSMGVDLNKEDEDGATPLYEAITNDDYEITKFLIANGANENKRTMDFIPSVEIKKRGWIIEGVEKKTDLCRALPYQDHHGGRDPAPHKDPNQKQ